VDHLIAPGLSVDAETHAPLLGGREFVVLASRGGGYNEGTPRHGWDHAEPWLPHAWRRRVWNPASFTAQLTLAHTNPAMAELIPLAEQSLAEAEHDVDELWTPATAATGLRQHRPTWQDPRCHPPGVIMFRGARHRMATGPSRCRGDHACRPVSPDPTSLWERR